MTTINYLNEFTPDWPHGHVLVFPDGTTRPLVVKVTDWPGEFPIWGHEIGAVTSWRFRADGSSNNTYFRLCNVAPPKHEPREVWVNVYRSGYGFVHTSRAAADGQVSGHGGGERRSECVRFREVIEEAATDEKLPEGFKLAKAKAALETTRTVWSAFKWASTPQGGHFWSAYDDNDLSPEDTARAREALKRWIAIAERRAAK